MSRQIQTGFKQRSPTSIKIERRMWQTICSLISTGVCFTPLWIFLTVYHKLGPVGFWEKLATLGLGAIIGGSVQFVLCIFWIMSLVFIASEIGPQDPPKFRQTY